MNRTNNFLKIVLQAARQLLIAQQNKKHSILICGIHTPIDPELLYFYDYVIKLPFLGGYLRKSSDMLLKPEETREYIIHSRGRKAVSCSLIEVKALLHGKLPYNTVEKPKEPPNENQILAMINLDKQCAQAKPEHISPQEQLDIKSLIATEKKHFIKQAKTKDLNQKKHNKKKPPKKRK